MGRKQKHVGNPTYEQKKRICQWHKNQALLTQNKLAEQAQPEFALVKRPVQATISTILKDRERYLNIRDEDQLIRRSQPLQFPALDEALANWFLQCQSRGVMLDGGMVKAKGVRLLTKMGVAPEDQMQFSNGWLQSFQGRHGFKSFSWYGESGSVDVSSITEQVQRIRAILSKYVIEDIYNFDETGLFYKVCRDKTIATRQIEGSKKSKTRLTVALACNANGSDMREPFFLYHTYKPRCFKKKTGEQLGFLYRNNKKSCMPAILFREWLSDFNVDMGKQKRKVALLIDNAPPHNITGMTLDQVVPLPPPQYDVQVAAT